MIPLWLREGRARWRAALVLLLLASSAAAGCSSPPALANTLSSDEAVAAAVLDRIHEQDFDGLMRLALSREEFERVVWPTLPASRPEVGVEPGYVWQDTSLRSRGELHQTLHQWGGQRLHLVRVEFLGQTTDHGTYSISRKTRLVVRDQTGAERRVRLFGSLIRQNGGSKVYSYIVD